MIGSAFFDDQPPTELPHWATITQVSDFLEIPRDAVRSAVRRASANNEMWVKKEAGEEENTYYLIDTTHEMYQSHQERWKHNKTLRTALLDESIPAWSRAGHLSFPSLSSEEDSFPLYTPVQHAWQRQKSREGVLRQWPDFRQWLYSHGIQVFQNLLADEGQKKLWEWRWGELHGEGFESDEEAIIAALQSRFDANEAEREEREETSSVQRLDLQKTQWRPSWFRGND